MITHIHTHDLEKPLKVLMHSDSRRMYSQEGPNIIKMYPNHPIPHHTPTGHGGPVILQKEKTQVSSMSKHHSRLSVPRLQSKNGSGSGTKQGNTVSGDVGLGASNDGRSNHRRRRHAGLTRHARLTGHTRLARLAWLTGLAGVASRAGLHIRC